ALTAELALTISDAAWEVGLIEDWRYGTALHMLLNVCSDAKGGSHEFAPPVQVALASHWVEIATRALWHAPDPVLYKDAVTRSVRAHELALMHLTCSERGDLLHGLGTLHLDPFMANRDSTISVQFLAWRERAERGQTWDGKHYLDIEKEGFPTLRV